MTSSNDGKLGTWMTMALVVGGIIGAGIFLLPGALAPRTAAKLPQLVGLLRDLYLRNDPVSYAKACRALAKMPRIAREDIGQPTLLVVGDHDRSTPIAMSEELHAEIPVSRVRVIPTAAHWVMLEQPDALSAAILEYLT